MKQKRLSLAASICWLLLMIGNCTATIAAPVGEMDCCDPVALSCCESASSALAFKFDNSDDEPTHLAVLQTGWSAFIENSAADHLCVAADWNPPPPHRRLHLINCSFQI